MKNIHNVVSDLMDIIDRRRQMTSHVEHRDNRYIRVHIHQGVKYVCIEVFEEQPDEYTDIVVLRQSNFSNRAVEYIMAKFLDCLDSGEPDQLSANSESSTRAGGGANRGGVDIQNREGSQSD